MISQNYDMECAELIDLHQKVKHMHPALNGLYPVAVVIDDRLHVYDIDQGSGQYAFRMDLPLPMPIPQGIRAAFPLDGYAGRMACVVSPDVFKTPDGYVTILHEFVHCFQFETCEQQLKMSLDVARKALEVGDFMWEIEHPFPYQALEFIRSYQSFLSAIAERSTSKVMLARQDLRTFLGVHDFEYLVWQEWKEGFARWVENKVKQRLNLQENRKDWTFLTAVFYFILEEKLISNF